MTNVENFWGLVYSFLAVFFFFWIYAGLCFILEKKNPIDLSQIIARRITTLILIVLGIGFLILFP